MSRRIGEDTLFLRPTPRLAHTEYSMEYHTTYLKQLGQPLRDAWDFDLLWCVHDGPIVWEKAGRTTDMGHAAYAADGSDRRAPTSCPFDDVEEVYAFDPFREYGIPEHGELVRFFEEWYQKTQAASPEQVVTGGRYKTVVSAAIAIFGWEMLLEAAGTDSVRFARVLERLGEYSIRHAEAWAETSIVGYIQHDDMVWTSGPFMNPGLYRDVIFPLYRRMWAPLLKAGKRVLFCSDGLFSMFMEDLASCGAQGFIFEPSNELEWICNRFGRSHVIIGSKVDCRTMAFGTWEEVKAQMDATFPLARRCPGFFWAVGNHIPANVSDAMCDRYIHYLKANWHR